MGSRKIDENSLGYSDLNGAGVLEFPEGITPLYSLQNTQEIIRKTGGRRRKDQRHGFVDNVESIFDAVLQAWCPSSHFGFPPGLQESLSTSFHPSPYPLPLLSTPYAPPFIPTRPLLRAFSVKLRQ